MFIIFLKNKKQKKLDNEDKIVRDCELDFSVTSKRCKNLNKLSLEILVW